MIEAALEQHGMDAEWQQLRNALPKIVADFEIQLVHATW